MKLDPILAEVRGAREMYAEQFDGDFHAMLEDLRRRHAVSDHPSATRERKLRPKSVASPGDGA